MTFPGTDICNIGGCLELEGKEDERLLQKMIGIFLKTQSSFWIRVNRGGRLYFEKPADYRMEEYDLRGKSSAETDAQIHRWMCEPFAVYDSPLFDFRLLRLDGRVVLFEKLHHLIVDGYGVALCARTQERIYQELLDGQTEFETDERSMRAVMEPEARCEEKSRETDLADRFGFVALCGRAVSPAAEVLSGFLTSGSEGETLWYPKKFDYQELRSFCLAHRISVEACIYGCLGILLCRTGNGDALAIARNLRNRSGETRNEIGLWVDTLTFAVRPVWDMTAARYLAQVKKELASQAKEKSAVPVRAEIGISYRPSRYLPAPRHGACREYQNSSVEIPVKLFVNDDGRNLELQVKYQKEALDRSEVLRLIRGMLFLLEQCLERPNQKVGELSILDAGDLAALQSLNDTYRWQYTLSLPERFLRSSEIYRKKTALRYMGEEYTYGRIREMAETVQKLIAERADMGKSRLVGLCLQRSPWMPAAVYGVWLAGCGFLPVSPRESLTRKQQIAETCALFLTDEDIRAYAAKKGGGRMAPDIRTDVPAYEIFTSGTTGKPKAVRISHRALACRLEWMEEQFGDGTDVILQKTRNTFDVSVWELALPFAFGKTMCVLKDGKEGDPAAIAAAIAENQVTMVHFVPSMFAAFLEYLSRHPVRLVHLKYMILSGEALDAGLVREAKRLLPETELYNFYGPAECTIDVSSYRCIGKEKKIPIGRPVYNTQLTVRNAAGERLPVGYPGELVIQGELVGLGYDSGDSGGYCTLDGQRAYRTGDMAVLSKDGYLYYLGRKDRQQKLRGMRINLDEIECSLNGATPGVRHSVLCILERLVDFYHGEMDEKEVEKKAAETLPYYSIPSEFLHIKEMPLNRNGKADKKELEDIYRRKLQEKSRAQEVFSEDGACAFMEKQMLALAKSLLQREDVTLDANLFDLGMDSLTTLRFLAECEDAGIRLDYAEIYAAPVIRKLAAAKDFLEPLVFLRRSGRKRLILMVPFAGGTPLSCRRLSDCLQGTDMDFAAVNLPGLGRMGVRQAAGRILADQRLAEYQEIWLAGACVGSALAVGLASGLKSRLKGLLLCEALPYTGIKISGKVHCIWDNIPDEMLARILWRLRGKHFKAGKEMLACFRQDVHRSARYLREGRQIRPDCPVVLVFGSADRITAGFRKKYVRWRRWVASDYHVCVIPKARHFLVEDEPEALAAILRRMCFGSLKKEKRGNGGKLI